MFAAGGGFPPSMNEIKAKAKKDSEVAQYYCIYCEVLHLSAKAVLEHDCSKLSSKQKSSYTCIHQSCGNRFKHYHSLDQHEKHCDGYGCHKEHKRGQIVGGKLVQGFPLSEYKGKGDFSGKEILYLTDFKK